MPYEPRDAHSFTRKANTGSRSRQWVAVYESSIARGDDEGTAITKANGAAKKNWTKTNPRRFKPADHRPKHMIEAAQGPVVKAPKIGATPKPISSAPRSMSRVVAAPTMKTAVAFAKEASASITDIAQELADPEHPPGRLRRWMSALERVREKKALHMTASVRLKRMRGRKHIPTVKASDLSDLARRMTSESKRMSLEGGKGPIVSKKKLWRKHTRRGGRYEDVSKSLESSRTFAAPSPVGQEVNGMRTVQFKVQPAKRGAKKAKR